MTRPDRRGRRAPGANRTSILAAAYEAIATLGYRAATTAEICRRAGVSSGTFFHYFPTKDAMLLALLSEEDLGPGGDSGYSGVTREVPTQGAVAGIVEEVIAQAADPHLPAFVREISTLVTIPRVAAVVADTAARRRARIHAAIEAEVRAGTARGDLPVEELARRVELLIDGFESAVASASPTRGTAAGAAGGAPGFDALAGSLRGAAADVVAPRPIAP